MEKDKDGYWVIWKLHPHDIKFVIEEYELDVELTDDDIDAVVIAFHKRFHSACDNWTEMLRDVIKENHG